MSPTDKAGAASAQTADRTVSVSRADRSVSVSRVDCDDNAASLSRTDSARRRFPVRRLTMCATLAAVAVILSAVESLIPVPVPAPGVKLGLANAATLFLLINDKNPLCAVLVTILRCSLSALLTGHMSVLLFSLSGGLVSCAIMWLLLHFNFLFSNVGVSVAGAISHNITQLATASIIARDPAVISYAPVLLLTGTLSGCAIGYVTNKVNKIININ